MNTHKKYIEIIFKTYKKEIFLYYLNILKVDKNNNSQYRLETKIQNRKNTTLIKKKVHNYIMLRATHEFKYSWEKYKEIIHKSFFSWSLSNKYTNISNLILYTFEKKLYFFRQKREYLHFLQQNELLSKLSSYYKSRIYFVKKDQLKASNLYMEMDKYILKNVLSQ